MFVSLWHAVGCSFDWSLNNRRRTFKWCPPPTPSILVLVIWRETSDFLLGYGHSEVVPGRYPGQPVWNSRSIHSWGVEGVSGCFSVTAGRSMGARAVCSSASAASPRPAWQGHACLWFLGSCVPNGVTRPVNAVLVSEVNWSLSPMAWPKFWCPVITSYLTGQAWSTCVLKLAGIEI